MKPRPTDDDRDVAQLLLETFRPRMDLFASRLEDPVEVDRFNAWRTERGIACPPARLGNYRPVGRKGKRRPVSPEEIAAHVAGFHTLGVYPMRPDGTCASVSADFDNHRGERTVDADPRVEFDAAVAVLEALGVPYLANHSRGGRGYWIHLLLPDGATARDARAVFHGVLRRAGVRHVDEGGTFDCLFPKQDEPAAVTDDPTARPGNLFCLPLSRKWAASDPPGTHFVGVAADDWDAQVAHLRTTKRIDAATWATLVAAYPVPEPSHKAPPRVRRVRRGTPPTDGRPSAWQLALARSGRLGAHLRDGKYAILCINDAAHSSPDGDAAHAAGSCVLLAPDDARNLGYPHCSHAHCASLSVQDWIHAIGSEVWEDACIETQGMKRVGEYLLHADGIATWKRAGERDTGDDDQPEPGAIVPDEPLANFSARIVANCVEFDGLEARRSYEIVAMVQGRSRTLRVPASDFGAMGWVAAQLGADAVIHHGRETRDQVREAIQLLSLPVPERWTFRFTGWHLDGSHARYLHAGGAIDAHGVVAGIDVALEGRAALFWLPPPLEGPSLVHALRACADLFRVGAPTVAFPLYAAPWRAALGECGTTIYLEAPPTLGKTLLASLAQQHYGPAMDERHLPATWKGATAASLNALRGIVGHAVFVVDDYVETGSVAEDARLREKVDTVVRAQHGGVGALRLSRDTRRVEDERPARSLLITTGELLPPGHSLRSRVIVLRMSERIGRDLAPLRQLAREGVYAGAMAAFVRWLAPRIADVRAGLARELAEQGAALGASASESRTVAMLADLLIGLRMFAAFAQDAGALTAHEANVLLENGRTALAAVARAQGESQRELDPVRRFVALLRSALGSGRCHVARTDGGVPESPHLWGWRLVGETLAPVTSSVVTADRWRGGGDCVGWLEDAFVWFDRDAAVAVVKRLAADGGDPFPLPAQALTQRLYDRGYLVETDRARGTRTVRKTIQGRRRDGLLCLAVARLEDDDAVEPKAKPVATGSDTHAN